jgi:hypothetical protein
MEIEVQAVSSIFFSNRDFSPVLGAFMTSPGADCTCDGGEKSASVTLTRQAACR